MNAPTKTARTIKLILGLLCVDAGFLPGSFALKLFHKVMASKPSAAPNVIVHQTFIIARHPFQGWEVYALCAGAALVAVGLAVGGMVLVAKSQGEA